MGTKHHELAGSRAAARSGSGSVALAAGLDVVSVLVFVAIGRRTHQEGSALRDTLETALPFLVGLAVAWAAVRAWHRPTHLVTAFAIWPITVLVGMLVRRWAFDRGTATSFVIVATLFLGACFVGWRLVHRWRSRRSRTRPVRPSV